MSVSQRIAAFVVATFLSTSGLCQAGGILFLDGGTTRSAAQVTADNAIIARLTGVLGYTVTEMDGHTATPADFGANSLLVTSASLGSSVIKNQWNSTGPVTTGGNGALYRNFPHPILNFQNGISDELGMTNSTNGGQGASANSGSAYPNPGSDVKILNPASPLAAGLPAGFQTIFTAPGTGVSVFGNSNFGPFGNQIAPGVSVIAQVWSLATGNAAIDTAFAGIESIEAGGALGNITPSGIGPGVYDSFAANRRVQFLLDPTSFGALNANGLALFDAAVSYAYSAAPEPGAFALATLGLASLCAVARRQRGKSST